MSAAQPSLLQQEIHTLYSDHHGWLFSWLRRKLGNAHQAADMAHDTFVRILTAHDPTPNGSPALQREALREPRAYLTTVANRVLLNHYRRLSLEQAWLSTLAQLPEPFTPSTEERLIILETLHEIDAMLDTLPARIGPRTRLRIAGRRVAPAH
jgi:DNA-directed RNA polymerase specialized sigma24 family protein